jgi:hypothetical protein
MRPLYGFPIKNQDFSPFAETLGKKLNLSLYSFDFSWTELNLIQQLLWFAGSKSTL